MNYFDLLEELNGYQEENFASFQRKLIFTKAKILGVRTPVLRKIGKKYAKDVETLMTFPDEYYEVTFIKLCAVSLLPYEEFLNYVEACVGLMDNWSTCDTFKPKCLKNRKEDFLPVLEKIFAKGGEYFERYALVTLLSFYVEEQYIPLIDQYIKRANKEKYYVHMAVAWLVAEILVKYPNQGKEILLSGCLEKKTHNKAIQKARESYRVTKEEKEYLNSLKIK
jgi:3-methyladenine DNA glycosylase AlkD